MKAIQHVIEDVGSRFYPNYKAENDETVISLCNTILQIQDTPKVFTTLVLNKANPIVCEDCLNIYLLRAKGYLPLLHGQHYYIHEDFLVVAANIHTPTNVVSNKDLKNKSLIIYD